MSKVVTGAGKTTEPARPDRRKTLIREATKLFRAAKTDDEAADAIEVILELARD